MGRLNNIDNQFKSIVQNDTIGFKAIRPAKGERYSFKALCEAAYAVHTSHISNDNLAHKEALKEIVLTAYKENTVDDKIKLTETTIEKKIKAGAAGAVLNFFTNFTKILKAAWKHLKLFVMSFFDVGSKVQLIQKRMENFEKRLKTDDQDFKTFLRTRYEDVDGIVIMKKGTYVATIKDLTNTADEITESFNTIHEKIQRSFGKKVLAKITRDNTKYNYEKSSINTDNASKKISDLKNTVLFNKKEKAKGTGETFFKIFKESGKALWYVYNTPPGASTNILDIMKKTKERAKDDVIDKLINDAKENFLKHNGFQNKETIDGLTTAIRKANSLLIEINGVSKIKMGEIIQVGITSMKLIKKHAKLDKIDFTTIKTENELNINLQTDAKSLVGKAVGAMVNKKNKKEEF